MEVLLLDCNSKPYVTKKDEKYYIYHMEYTDDVDLLLNSIKNVKEITWNEYINKKSNSKEEHWQNEFNHSYSGSCSIFKSPSEMWNDELTRQGKLFCPICNSKMIMYYRSYCPSCYGLQKYEYSDYFEMVNIVETKYGFEVRDYHKFKNLENEYFDYWHFLLDNYFDGCVENAHLTSINWKEVYDVAEEEWQKEITDCFLKEFGDHDYDILISW